MGYPDGTRICHLVEIQRDLSDYTLRRINVFVVLKLIFTMACAASSSFGPGSRVAPCLLSLTPGKPVMATQPIAQFPDPAFVYGQGADLQSLNVLTAEIANTDIPVLLVGESGTGKDVYARLIHRLSGAPENSFERVNCGALDPGRMLGDVRDAFQTDADTVDNF